MTEHENRALTSVEAVDRARDARAAFAREQTMLRVGGRSHARGARFIRARDLGVDEPSIVAALRLAPIQAAVDEDAREPYFERPRFTIRGEMGKRLDERVLNGLVGVTGVAKILVGN